MKSVGLSAIEQKTSFPKIWIDPAAIDAAFAPAETWPDHLPTVDQNWQ